MAWYQWVPMVIAAVGKVAGGFNQADSVRRQANANILEGEETANAREESIRRNTALELGKQRASIFQSGFTPSGSDALLVKQSAGEGELAALTARFDGISNAWRMRTAVNQAYTEARTQLIFPGVPQGSGSAFAYMNQGNPSSSGSSMSAGGGTQTFKLGQ